MRKYLAILIGVLFLPGCDMFISRGGEGQKCFSETNECSGGLICDNGRCVREVPDGGQDGGDDGFADEDDSSADAADEGGDDGGSGDGDGTPSQTLHIYRSVGPYNGVPLMQSQAVNELTFTDSQVIFPAMIVPVMGVGDVIQFDTDTDNNPDAVVFIHEIISSDQVRVAKADGTPYEGTLTTRTWSVLRAYTSLADAITLDENPSLDAALADFDNVNQSVRDLVDRNLIWNIACYTDNAADDTEVTIDHWTTSEDNFLRIFTPVASTEVGESQRHRGRWTNNAYRLDILATEDNVSAIVIGDAYVHIDGLQIGKNGNTAGRIAIGIKAVGTTNLRLSNSIVRGTISNGQGVFVDANCVLKMWNTMIIDAADSEGDGVHFHSTATGFIYNSTIYNSHRGIYLSGNTPSDVMVINVLAAGNSDYDFDGDSPFAAGSSHNCSSDTSAPPPNSITTAEPVELFEDPTTPPYNLHLKSGAPCEAQGIILLGNEYISFSDDIDGEPRQEPWDIGADDNGS